MNAPNGRRADRRRLWKFAGIFTFLLCVIPWFVMTGACVCCDAECETPPPPAECTADPNGTEVRAVEVYDALNPRNDVGPRMALRSGDEISRVVGFQGSDMVTSRIWIAAGADPDPDGTERCMQVSYAGMTMNFTSDLIFEREGDYWVLGRDIFDPIESGGSFTQTISVRDATLTGDSTLTLTVR